MLNFHSFDNRLTFEGNLQSNILGYTNSQNKRLFYLNLKQTSKISKRPQNLHQSSDQFIHKETGTNKDEEEKEDGEEEDDGAGARKNTEGLETKSLALSLSLAAEATVREKQ